MCIPDSHGQVGDGAQPRPFRWSEVQSLIAIPCIDLRFLSLGASCPFLVVWPPWRLPANDWVIGHGYVSTTKFDAEESMAFLLGNRLFGWGRCGWRSSGSLASSVHRIRGRLTVAVVATLRPPCAVRTAMGALLDCWHRMAQKS